MRYVIAYVQMSKTGPRPYVWAGITREELDAAMANISKNPMTTIVFAGKAAEEIYLPN